MHKNMALHVVGGRLDLIHLKQFPDRVVREQMQGSTYVIPEIQSYQAFEYLDRQENMPTETIYSQREIKPKHISEITGFDMMRQMGGKGIRAQGKYFADEMNLEHIHNAIINDFKIMVAQANPSFFLKDLDMDSINKLSLKDVEQGGNGELGIEVTLSQYQKFFVICNSSDFKFIYNTVQEMSRDCYTTRGALVNLNPRRFIVGRYENLVYLNELNAMRIYQK